MVYVTKALHSNIFLYLQHVIHLHVNYNLNLRVDLTSGLCSQDVPFKHFPTSSTHVQWVYICIYTRKQLCCGYAHWQLLSQLGIYNCILVVHVESSSFRNCQIQLKSINESQINSMELQSTNWCKFSHLPNLLQWLIAWWMVSPLRVKRVSVISITKLFHSISFLSWGDKEGAWGWVVSFEDL